MTEENPNIEINDVELQITEGLSWLLSKPKRIKIAVGGRGSQKSTGMCDIMLMFADQGERICCAREYQNSIDDSVHENLKIEIDRLGVEGFKVLANEIRSHSGGELFYKGLARNITSLKSLAGVNRLLIEEGESVSGKSLKVLTPSIRSSAASNMDENETPPEIWIAMNRGSSQGAIARKYLRRAEAGLKRHGRYEDDLIMVVQLNWRDNPWFPPELEQERQDDYDNLPRSEYDSIWENAYDDSVDRAIIRPEWFDACVDAHLELGIKARGARVLAHDPSDEGHDNKGMAFRHGIVVTYAAEKDDGNVNEGMDWALEKCEELSPDLFVWDGDGMGVGLRRQAEEALDETKTDYVMFKGSEGPEDPTAPYDGKFKKENKLNQDVFRKKRSQYWMRLANSMRKTYEMIMKKGQYPPEELISFSSEMGQEILAVARAELCSVPTKPDRAGFIQIMPKPEMKSLLGIESQNVGDSIMMLQVIPDSKSGIENNWVPPKVHRQERSASRREGRRR